MAVWLVISWGWIFDSNHDSGNMINLVSQNLCPDTDRDCCYPVSHLPLLQLPQRCLLGFNLIRSRRTVCIGFTQVALGPLGNWMWWARNPFLLPLFPICGDVIWQQVTGASGGVGNPCKAVMSINDSSKCADGQCYFCWWPGHRYC